MTGSDVKKRLRVLVACEFSGVVRNAFREAGHDAWSCDILDAEDNSQYHIKQNVMEHGLLSEGWDMMIGHPPCTHLSLAGARWFYDERFPHKRQQQEQAMDFFKELMNAPIPKIAIENPQPLGVVMDRVGRYTQKFQPWNFGDRETKGICLWLRGLPKLEKTVTIKPDDVKARVWRMPPGPDRQKERSRFFPGVAKAMAEQWGGLT